jgi:hypothetical protein
MTPSHPSSPSSKSTSGSSGSNSIPVVSRDDGVNENASALVDASNLYAERRNDAFSKGDYYDDFVQVELSSQLSTEQLGQACQRAKHRVGRLGIVAVGGKVFVRQVTSGHKHGDVAGEVFRVVRNVVLSYSDGGFVAPSYDSLFGNIDNISTAPDITVRSLGLSNGDPSDNLALAPVFFAEVEDGNRSLPALIRQLGMLLANFPRLNGVLGIKGERDANNQHFGVLVLIEWRGIGVTRQSCVTNLVDFGPNEMTSLRRSNAEVALGLPLPPPNVIPRCREHGAGVEAVPQWVRYTNGLDIHGNTAIVKVSPSLLLAGACRQGDSAIVDIAPNAIPAEINLKRLCSSYFHR